jgi:PAS domain S-box-containing protein
MATSPDFARLAGGAVRPLTDDVFDALREAVIVVDPRSGKLPVILANAAARRCILGEPKAAASGDVSLHALLGPVTESVVAAALGTLTSGKSRVNRTLTWRLPRGEMQIPTELQMLGSAPDTPKVMLTFPEPSSEPLADPGVLWAVDQVPLDLLILGRDLTVLHANAGAIRTAATPADGLLSFSALLFAPTSAIPRRALEGALDGQSFHDDSIAVPMPGAVTRWFEVELQPLRDESGVVGVAVLSMEVTERRRRRRARSGSERRASALGEQARDFVTVTARDGRLVSISGGVTGFLGYTPQERLSHSIFQHVHPEDLGVLRAKYLAVSTGAIRGFSRQLRVRHKDEAYRWLELSCMSALDNPLIEGVVVSARDITERKQAETRLAQREEVFKLAADAVNGIIFEWDLSRGVVHRSRGVHDVLGMQPKELESVSAWSDRIHPQDNVAYEDKIAAALASGRGWTASYRIRNLRGRYRSVVERGLIQRSPSGEPVRAIGCVVDVSEIKRLTDLLAEAQRVAQIGGWEYSYATHELEWTEEMFRIYETTPKDFVVSWHSMMAQCPPDSRARVTEAIERAESADGKIDLELEIMTLTEKRIWVRFAGQIEKLDGRPFRAFGSVQNVQAQKVAQISLENSTDWLKLSMTMAHMHAWRWNRATDTIEYAIVNGQTVGLPGVFPGMKKLMSRVHPKDRAAVRRAIDDAVERHTEVQTEFRLKSQDGRYRAYAAVARPVFDAANNPSGLVGVTQDVTARHESEARLRRSEELLRTTTANTADTLLLLDNHLMIRFINRDACAMRMDEIIGQDIAVLLPREGRESLMAKLYRVLTTGDTETYEFELHATGVDAEYFENRAVQVREEGLVTGISITMRNITERKRLEQEILDVSSRERQAIGRDLHDGLGQELTGVALMLRGLATRIETQSAAPKDQVDEIVGLVNQSIETARSLARGLMPVTPDAGGLEGALRSLADRSRDLYGLTVDFRVKVSPDRSLSEVMANHLYRIAQEALTNTARHAQATSVAIYLLVTTRKFLLRIIDDGVGIDQSVKSESGMGLKIMRYRASMIGATFEILPNQPRGTLICVTSQHALVTCGPESLHAT